jgi:hypothetical protein
MKFVLSRLGSLACASLIAACVSSGNRTIKDVNQEGAAHLIQAGISRKADIVRAFGDAKINKFDSGYEVWTYRYTETTAKVGSFVPIVGALMRGSDKHVHELEILFNPAGVVTKFRVYDGLSED